MRICYTVPAIRTHQHNSMSGRATLLAMLASIAFLTLAAPVTAIAKTAKVAASSSGKKNIRKVKAASVKVDPIALATAVTPPTTTPVVCSDPGSEEVRQACNDFTAEIQTLKNLQVQLSNQKSRSGTLQKNVNELITQITNTQSKIRNQITQINTLTLQIHQKVAAINDLASELDQQHASMTQLVKRTDDIDQRGPLYLLLSSNTVSDFYHDLDDFYSIKQALLSTLNRVKSIKTVTEKQKSQLQDKQSQALNAKKSLEGQKSQLAVSQKQVQDLLNTSKSEEQRQAAMILDQQKKVAAIQSKLFSFAGGNTAAIKFKDAYAYASEASDITGVRTAFILAILTQESNLGKNVGTCNRKTDPAAKSWKNIMSPTRDQGPFQRITAALGLDPDTTPVSCPVKGGGWGGAMGPAQFIPSTWEKIASQVATGLGKSTANPWVARDAIMASAVYLKAIGGAGGQSAERNTACRYYSGRSCDSRAPKNSFYGNSVVSLAAGIQNDIDYLNKYGVSRR